MVKRRNCYLKSKSDEDFILNSLIKHIELLESNTLEYALLHKKRNNVNLSEYNLGATEYLNLIKKYIRKKRKEIKLIRG